MNHPLHSHPLDLSPSRADGSVGGGAPSAGIDGAPQGHDTMQKPKVSPPTSPRRRQEFKQLPRSVRWRLSLGLLTTPSLPSEYGDRPPSTDTVGPGKEAVCSYHPSVSSNTDAVLSSSALSQQQHYQSESTKPKPNCIQQMIQIESQQNSHDNKISSLLKSIEDANALRLRSQRSRYDDLEKRHYWSSTPMGIEGSLDGDGNAVSGSGAQDNGDRGQYKEERYGLHHVAKGEDPLSALLNGNGNSSNNNDNSAEGKKPFGFGGNKRNIRSKTTNASATTTAAPRSRSNSRDAIDVSLHSSHSSKWEEDDNEACRGSRWADFYSTREVLDVIEKDLNRLPTDHYTIYHEWRRKMVGWKEEREGEEEQRKMDFIAEETPMTQELQYFDRLMQVQQEQEQQKYERARPRRGLNLGRSFRGLNGSFTKGAGNNINNTAYDAPNGNTGNNTNVSGPKWNFAKRSQVNASSAFGGEEDDEAQKQQTAEKLEIDISIKERAERLSQILFVYAREHPEIGYRQGMHEILSYVLLVLEMDLLQQATEDEKKRLMTESLSPMGMSRFGSEGSACKTSGESTIEGGGMAGVDSSGNIVVIRLLDTEHLLHDAFNIFECIMMALAPAYDAIPVGDETTATLMEAAKIERGESPMEQMTSSIVSKIRYVARDEALFSHVLYMPVPPQLYFAKWVRLMFGREMAGGMKDVMRLWDAFFDLAWAASALDNQTEVSTSMALMNVLKTAAASMILLIRPNLLAPTLSRDGTMTGEPDPNEGIGYLMNYPPVEDIGLLVKTISSLLAKERNMSKQYQEEARRASNEGQRRQQEERHVNHIDDPLQHMSEVRDQDDDRGFMGWEANVPNARSDDDQPRVFQPIGQQYASERMKYPAHGALHQRQHEVSESIGHIAAGLFEFGSKTVDAAIAQMNKHNEVPRRITVEHPLAEPPVKRNMSSGNLLHMLGFGNKEGDKLAEERRGTRASNGYDVSYRPTPPLDSSETDASGTIVNAYQTSLRDGSSRPPQRTRRGEESPNPEPANTFNGTLQQVNSDLDSVGGNGNESLADDWYNTSGDLMKDGHHHGLEDASISSRRSHAASRDLGISIRKSPKVLAFKLERSVATLMRHFNEQMSSSADLSPKSGDGSNAVNYSAIIPDTIWDAMADIDQVRKDLQMHEAMDRLELGESTRSISSRRASERSLEHLKG